MDYGISNIMLTAIINMYRHMKCRVKHTVGAVRSMSLTNRNTLK